ncbi:MAG TPA: hypothetical protein VFV31_14365 [Chitinophagaceae bacterium]|nr:hypothetical protein [Chitinophagaceae bacterium]
MMKKLLLPVLLFTFSLTSIAQELAQVAFTNGSTLAYLSLITDRTLLIRINDQGTIMEWGTEESSYRNSNYYAPRLQPYPGRVEYYGQDGDSLSRGKLKSIGSAVITYYDYYESEERRGKIRSIGRQFFDYYNNFYDKQLRGKIKSIGNLFIDFYASFENESLRGKIKSVGSTGIAYYSSFDDRLIRGKIKSIGNQPYVWYTSVDQVGYGGSLKSGPFRQNIGGITYILQ